MKAPLNYKCIMMCVVDRPETTQHIFCKFCIFPAFIYYFMITKYFIIIQKSISQNYVEIFLFENHENTQW